jgi:hypothetical protein
MADIELDLDPIKPRRGESLVQAIRRDMEEKACKCGAWTPLRRKDTKEPVCKYCLDLGEPTISTPE